MAVTSQIEGVEQLSQCLDVDRLPRKSDRNVERVFLPLVTQVGRPLKRLMLRGNTLFAEKPPPASQDLDRTLELSGIELRELAVIGLLEVRRTSV